MHKFFRALCAVASTIALVLPGTTPLATAACIDPGVWLRLSAAGPARLTPERRITLTMKIREEFHDIVRQGSVAKVNHLAILGDIGIVPLAVTTSLTINVLRKPDSGRDIVGECRLMKLGRTLAVGEVWLYSEGESEPVAHVVGTYAIPRSPA